LLAKPSLLNINLSNDRFSMFNKRRDIARSFIHAAYYSCPLLPHSWRVQHFEHGSHVTEIRRIR
jgi:hypothetical protein